MGQRSLKCIPPEPKINQMPVVAHKGWCSRCRWRHTMERAPRTQNQPDAGSSTQWNEPQDPRTKHNWTSVATHLDCAPDVSSDALRMKVFEVWEPKKASGSTRRNEPPDPKWTPRSQMSPQIPNIEPKVSRTQISRGETSVISSLLSPDWKLPIQQCINPHWRQRGLLHCWIDVALTKILYLMKH